MPQRKGFDQRWAGLGVVLVGTLIVALDATIVAIALPQIGKALDAGDNIQWVVTANLLAVAISMPSAGWIANRIGTKQLFLSALACFSLASLGAALAPSLGVLIAMRALQGMCSGVINPISMTIVLDLFEPKDRGRAMGVWGLVSMTAPAVGPTLGGYIVTAVSWHWLFLPNVPLGLLGAIVGRRMLVDSPKRPHTTFDALGLLLGGTGLALFLFTLSQSRIWGWGSSTTIGCLLVAVVLLSAFARHVLTVDEPLLDLRLARNPVFGKAMLIVAFLMVPQYARSVFVPQQLQKIRGLSPLHVGTLLTPSAVATAFSMAIGGRLVDRWGARTPTLIGCALMMFGTAGNAFLSLSTPEWWIAASLTVQGLGVGMIMIPAIVVGLNALPDAVLPQASTLRSMSNQTASATAVALLFALVNARLALVQTLAGQQRAYNTTFQAGVIALVLATLVAVRLPGRVSARR